MTGDEGGGSDRSGDGLADDRAHAAGAEAEFQDAENDVMRAQHADGVDDRVVEPGFSLGFFEALLVRLQVVEFQRIGRAKSEVYQFVAGFKEIVDAGAGVDAEVMAAVGADLLIGFEFRLEEDLAAVRAADPQALGADGLLRVVDDLMVFALEPPHACLPSRRCLDYCSGEKTKSGLHATFLDKSLIFSEMLLGA